MCPCKQCLKFAICKGNKIVECIDLFSYIIDKGVYSWTYKSDERVEEVLQLFDKLTIEAVSSIFYTLTFSDMRYGYREFLKGYELR